MGAPNYGTAAQQSVLMLQKINENLALVQNLESGLDAQFRTATKPDSMGLQQYRMPVQTEVGGVSGIYQPDGGSYMHGTGPQYDQGLLAPIALMLSFAQTELSERIAKGGKDIVVEDYVSEMIANAKTKMAHKRNQYLQPYNNGQLATVDASYTAGSTTIPLASQPFGGRLVDRGDLLQIADANYNILGTATALDIQKNSIGNADVLSVDQIPTGLAAGYTILMPGVASGTPIGINGLKYLVSPSTTGEFLGINRGNSYVQSPSFNANGSFLTLGMVTTFMARMKQALGTSTFAKGRTKNVWYGHPTQAASAQYLGFAKQQIIVGNGTNPNYDGFSNPFAKIEIGGIEFVEDTTASVTDLYWLDRSTLVRIRYPDSERFLEGPVAGMFWPLVINGQWTSQRDMYYQDSVNYAVTNAWANGVITNLGVQASFSN